MFGYQLDAFGSFLCIPRLGCFALVRRPERGLGTAWQTRPRGLRGPGRAGASSVRAAAPFLVTNSLVPHFRTTTTSLHRKGEPRRRPCSALTNSPAASGSPRRRRRRGGQYPACVLERANFYCIVIWLSSFLQILTIQEGNQWRHWVDSKKGTTGQKRQPKDVVFEEGEAAQRVR